MKDVCTLKECRCPFALPDHDPGAKYGMTTIPESISFTEMSKMFGKPVFYVKKADREKSGWLIVYELHITECGEFVTTESDRLFSFDDYQFYRNEHE